MKNYIPILFLFIVTNSFSQRIVDKDMGNFNQVKVFDLIEVNLIKSDENKVLIKGNNVDDINLVVKDGVLKIRMELDKIFSGDNTFVEVYYTELNLIDGNEGAKITSNETIEQNTIELRAQEGARIKVGLKLNHLEARAVTGGIIEASGITENQEVVLNTGGIFEGKDLRTEITSIKVSAGGEAEIYASESANINIKAGGDVEVYGNPKEVKKNTFAGGRIRIID